LSLERRYNTPIMRDVRILVTGGTIDDLDYAEAKQAPERLQSIIPSLLEQYRLKARVEIEVLMLKDSRHITNVDRELLRERCVEVEEKGIIITHGTITMADTARYLGRGKLRKTVVLTGAMVPPSEQRSDTPFNLGYALAAAQHLRQGVFVAMNGRIFHWRNVRKNVEQGIFEEEDTS
jgi:L-asparaginase